MNEMIAEASVKSGARAVAGARAPAKKPAPITLTENIVEIVSDSGEGAQARSPSG